jgi:hypothetical protein
MPEISDSSQLTKLGENPYPVPAERLMSITTEQLQEAAMKGMASTSAGLRREGKAHLIPRAEEIYKVAYNVFLLGPETRVDAFSAEGSTDQEKRDTVLAAQISHKLVHHAWAAKEGILTPDQLRAVTTVIQTTEGLLTRPMNDSAIVGARQRWSGMKAELAAVDTYTREDWSVILPNHKQPFDPRNDRGHEIYQMDLRSGVDFIVKVPTERGFIGILVDTKSRVSLRDQVRVERKDYVADWKDLNPVVKRLLSEHKVQGFVRAEVGIGTDCYNYYRPNEPVSKFADLKQESKSAIVVGTGQLVRSYIGA